MTENYLKNYNISEEDIQRFKVLKNKNNYKFYINLCSPSLIENNLHLNIKPEYLFIPIQ